MNKGSDAGLRHTTLLEDFATVIATICVLEGLKFAFGWQVATACSVTWLICCVAFLYHAGKSRALTKVEDTE